MKTEMLISFSFNIQKICLVFLIAFITSSISDSPSMKFSSSDAEKFSNAEVPERRVKRQYGPVVPTCFHPVVCNDISNVFIYRTPNGICNNLLNPYWGASNIPFLRRLPRDPSGDHFRCPHCPNPRNVSTTINAVMPPGENDGITLTVMQWGQITDHDLVFTPEDDVPPCCQDFRTPHPTSPSCCPINVTDDSFYGSFDPPITCLQFIRSKPSPCADSSDRETINERTVYLDASSVYGSTEVEMFELREFHGGKLKIGDVIESGPCVTKRNECPRTYLPTRYSEADGFVKFFAGDHRVEHQPALTSLHTVLNRLHNYLADKLHCVDDETTFQIARKIVGALVQQITFGEFLPIVLGPNYMTHYDLTLKPATDAWDTFNNGYDPTLPASAANVFATAAFRFGHSLVANAFTLSSGVTVQLAEVFENHAVTLNHNSEPSHFLSAIIMQDAEPMDHVLVDALINKLLALSPFTYGSDLYARNIKRGRDHGIPGYIHWFNRCADIHGYSKIAKFNDLKTYMPQNVVKAFKNLYKNVEDIDLFPAGIAEFAVPGGLVGPTFACLIGEQFYHIKYGDRFWFENSLIFSEERIQSIRKTKLAALICYFTGVEFSQENVMLKVSATNPIKKCKKIWKTGVLKDIKTDIWRDIC